MDKRLIILTAITIALSAGFFTYKKFFYKHTGIQYSIDPKTIVKTNDSISFDNQTADATRWKWDFGDGEFSASQSGKHAYLQPGHYTVRVAAYGSFGAVVDSTRVVDVMPSDNYAATHTVEAPAAISISGPGAVNTGSATNFESAGNAASYEWTIEGDATLSGRVQKAKVATYSFSKPGRKTVVLTTHKPDLVVRKDINVTENVGTVAGERPLPPPPMVPASASASVAKKPAVVEHPVKQQQHQPTKDKPKSGLKDLGEGVEY